MGLLFMVLCEDTIGKSFLLPADIRKEIPEDHICLFFLLQDFVDCVDFSDIDSKYRKYFRSKSISCCNASSYNLSEYHLFYSQ